MKSTTYNSLWNRMLYDSAIKTWWGKVLFVLILVITLALAVHTWIGWLTPLSNLPVIAYGLFMAFTGSLIGLFLIHYFDRRTPQPFWLFAGVIVIAVMVTTPPAAFINGRSPVPTLTVGFNEEFWKVLPLLLLVFFAPTVVTGARDGLIIGALGGVGFNIAETASYFLRVAYPDQGFEGIYSQLARLSWWGIGNHAIWSALVGLGIGMAVQTDNRRTRILAPLGTYLLAAFIHLLQDNGLSALIMVGIVQILLSLSGADISSLDPSALATMTPSADVPLIVTATMSLALPLEALVINIVPLAILVNAMRKSGNWERAVIREELADESAEVITPEEYAGVQKESRFRLRRIPGYARHVGRQIRNAQNALAFHKRYLHRKGRAADSDPLAQYWRTEIVRLRK